LSGIWIDSIAVSECQHSSIIECLLDAKQPVIVNLRGIEPLKLTWGSPCIPRAHQRLQRGVRNSSPSPLTQDKTIQQVTSVSLNPLDGVLNR
jgi:hypothetical protein